MRNRDRDAEDEEGSWSPEASTSNFNAEGSYYTGQQQEQKDRKPTAKKPQANKAPLPRGLACSICRKRKLRCDGTRPSCSTCSRLGHLCLYGDPIHEKLNERNRELQAKIDELTAELEAIKQQDHSAQLPPLAQGFEFLPPGVPAPNEHATSYLRQPEAPSDSYSHPSPALHLQTKSNPPSASSSPFPSDSFQSLRDSQAFNLPPMDTFPTQNLQSFPFSVTGNPPSIQNLMNPSPSPFEELNPSQHSSPYTSFHEEHLRSAQGLSASSPINKFSAPASDWRWQNPPLHSPLPSTGLIHVWGGDLPDLDLIVQLSNFYFVTVHIHLPFMNRSRFLMSLHQPSSLSSPPSLCLVFAILAIAAPYHNDPTVRERGKWWYQRAKVNIDNVINSGINNKTGSKTNLSLEIVQALLLLELIEMGQMENQRAFMTMGSAVRISSMLGLHRMDEDRIAERLGLTSDLRLRPPAIHPLPTDSLLLEECRRTMCAVFVVDRLESGATGWPYCVAETDIRLLLPCDEKLYDSGTCEPRDNPLWYPVWPTTLENEDNVDPSGPRVGSFGWLVRVALLGGRIQAETYRASGVLADGPFRLHDLEPLLDDDHKRLTMDHELHVMRNKLNAVSLIGANPKVFNPPILMSLILVNCLFINLHHLRVARLRNLPYDPNGHAIIGSPEYSMQRCLEGINSMKEIISRAAAHDDVISVPYHPRITIFTTFLPYILYATAFPAKFMVGESAILGADRSRSEKVPGRLVVGRTGPLAPSGDDVFGPAADQIRVDLIDALCDAMSRIGLVWEIGLKFVQALKGDRNRLAERASARRYSPPFPNHQRHGNGVRF